MGIFHLIMLVLALVCFLLAAVGVRAQRVELMPLGLTFLTVALIIASFPVMVK